MEAEKLKKYMVHLSTCNKMKDWYEADEAMSYTPMSLRDASYYEAVEQMNALKNVCTCGLDDILKEIDSNYSMPKKVKKSPIPELRENEVLEYKDGFGYWYCYTLDLQNSEYFEPFAIRIREMNVPKSEWGVHGSHCCQIHGCKYGDKDCPVVLGKVPGIDCEKSGYC